MPDFVGLCPFIEYYKNIFTTKTLIINKLKISAKKISFFSKNEGYLLSFYRINSRTRIIKEPVLIIKTQKNENFICEQRNKKF